MGFWESLGEVASGFVDGLVEGAGERGRIHRLCRQLDWPIDEDTGKRIRLDFKDRNAEEGLRQVYVIGGDGTLVQFRCMSHAFFSHGNEPPIEVVGYLMRKNADIGFGGWALSMTERSVGFALDYVAIGAGLDAAMLKVICLALVKEASEFDGKMRKAGLL